MQHIPNLSHPKTAALRLDKTLTALALLALLLTISTGNVSLAQSDVPNRSDRPETESMTHESITFTWGAPPSGDQVTGYQILRQQPMVHDSDFYTILGTTMGMYESNRRFTDNTISGLWDYRYRIRAINSQGMSVKSYSLWVRTPAPPDDGTPPTLSDPHDPDADLGTSALGVPFRHELNLDHNNGHEYDFTKTKSDDLEEPLANRLADRTEPLSIEIARTDRLEHAGSKHAYKFELENDKIYIVHIDTPPDSRRPRLGLGYNPRYIQLHDNSARDCSHVPGHGQSCNSGRSWNRFNTKRMHKPAGTYHVIVSAP